jgi:site-specific DNA recombinase
VPLTRHVSATQLETFVVARIRDIGRDPALLEETLRAIEADREREKPQLEKEQRRLAADLAGCRGEARKLVAALGAGGTTSSLTTRLGELDERAEQLETRLGEVADALAALDRQALSRDDVAKALADFDPVWEALVPREKASLLALLVDRVEYDGTDVAITFRGEGVERRAA